MGKGQAVALTPKGFDLLLALVRNAGHVVGKEELMREIWPDTFVEENNLTVNISALRKVLGEGASDQRYIHTVPRRGYRFAASVRQSVGIGAACSARERNRRRRFGVPRGPRTRAAQIGRLPARGHRRSRAHDLYHRRARHWQNGSFACLFAPGAVGVSDR